MVILILIKIINEANKNKSAVEIEMPLAAKTSRRLLSLRVFQPLARPPLAVALASQGVRASRPRL